MNISDDIIPKPSVYIHIPYKYQSLEYFRVIFRDNYKNINNSGYKETTCQAM